MSDQTQTAAAAETLPPANTAFDHIPDTFVPLDQLGVAPENLRADEGPDGDIPQLADTLYFAGQVHPLLVRPGKGKKEQAYMALDGRRRRFGWLHNAEAGRVAADQPVRVKVITDKALQVAAATLPNTQQQAPDLVHVIRATGRLVQRRMSPTDIARALGGYTVKEVAGWAKLAVLQDVVLERLREGKITLGQAKQMTKLSAEDQTDLAREAKSYGLYDHVLRARVSRAVVTVGDARVRLAGLDAYAAAGGRIEADLFGETADQILDPQILQTVWDAAAQPIADHLAAQGLVVAFKAQSVGVPEGFQMLTQPWYVDVSEEEQDAVDDAERLRDEAAGVVTALQTLDGDGRDRLLNYLDADLAYRRALGQNVGACSLAVDEHLGVSATFYGVPAPLAEDDEEDEPSDQEEFSPSTPRTIQAGEVVIPKVELETGATSHALVERYTDVATRGLIRSLADDPGAALILVVARLFVTTVLPRAPETCASGSISTLKASAYQATGFAPIAALDGEVQARLEARRQTYLASGLRPIPWVSGLSHGERMTFLAELMAVTLDGREWATHAQRHGARAEAIEVVELIGHDIRNHWLPDLPFFLAHNKAQLLGMLEKMGEDTGPAGSLKKGDLAARVATAAGDHSWAPDALSWRSPAAVEVVLDEAVGEEMDEDAALEEEHEVVEPPPIQTADPILDEAA